MNKSILRITSTLYLSLIALVSFGQAYYVEFDEFPPDFDLSNASTYQALPFDESLTNVVNMTFTWDFFGQSIFNYYASDNGYIQFDNQQPSNPNNTFLPNSNAPKGAIFGLWSDLALQAGGGTADEMAVFSYGPNGAETNGFLWWSVTEKSSGQFTYCAIALHEDGGFSIIHWLDGGTSANYTVGVQDTSASYGLMVPNSPNYQYPGQNEVKWYRFFFGSQPSYDMAILNNNFSQAVGEKGCLEIEVQNWGSETINSLDFNWKVDGGATQTTTITGLNIATGEKAIINNQVNLDYPTPGQIAGIQVDVDNLNGNADENPGNSVIVEAPFVTLGYNGTKKVLLEEFTTAPCQFCPDGKVVVDAIVDAYPNNVIPASIHAGFGTDAMTTADHSTIAARFVSGAPTASVDRVMFPGNSQIGHSRGDWPANTLARIETPTIPVCINIDNSYNSGTRELSIDVSTAIEDYIDPNKTYHMTVYVIEDNVTGTGSGYDQVNAYNNQTGHPYAGTGNPIVGYVHPDVVREIPTSVWGDASYFTSTPSLGSTFSKNYTVTLDNAWDDTEIKIAAFMHEYDAGNDNNMQVLNANETDIGVSSPLCVFKYTNCEVQSGVEEVENTVVDSEVFPNPIANGKLTLSATFTEASEVVVDVYNNLGQKVVTSGTMQAIQGKNRYFVDTDQLISGNYIVVLSSEGERLFSKKIVVAK